MRQYTPGLTLAGIAALLLVACSGGAGSGDDNSAPTANAGANQTVAAGATVTLNGSASSDSDGTIALYSWTQSGGSGVTLNNSGTAQPTFAAPSVSAATTLNFALIVTDNQGRASAPAMVSVTVNPATNLAPTANAGASQTVTAGATVTLNGTASSDSDGTIASYAWTQTAGTAITLSSATAPQPTFTAPPVATVTTLTFSLIVTDNRAAPSAASTVSITVNPAANVAPMANAGTNQTVGSGVTVTLNGTASSDADGTIASYAWTQTAGTAVTLNNGTTSQPTFTAPTVATAATLTFRLIVTDNRGATSAPSTVNVIVNPPVAGNVNVTGNVTFARVPFASSMQDPNRGLWYAAPVHQPARGVIVRALDANSQVQVATGSTDNLGSYTLSVPGNANITIQVVARMLRDTTQALPRWDVRVQDGIAGNTPYTYTDAAFNAGAGTARNVAIPTGIDAAGNATGARSSAPFAILDTIYQGIQTIVGVAPTTNFPALVVDWGSQTAGTFFSSGSPQYIALLSNLAADTDEFDQHVVAHEFGHYIEENFSRADSIGGQHALGDKLDPRVAFGEGFGYAFAAMVLNDADARDSGKNNADFYSTGFNIEANPQTSMVGAPGDNYGCWCSESSVWSILWDLYDTPADANDALALGFAPIWQVLTGVQRTTPALTTIFPFITALKAARPGDVAAINTLIAAQNIATTFDEFGTGETHVPTNVASAAAVPLFTTITLGNPVTLRNVNDAGLYNKLGNHRFLRFTPSVSGTVNITLATSSASNDPDFLVRRSGNFVLDAEDAPPGPETGAINVTAGTTYVLDVYDCENGCVPEETTVGGDYDLTVTIN